MHTCSISMGTFTYIYMHTHTQHTNTHTHINTEYSKVNIHSLDISNQLTGDISPNEILCKMQAIFEHKQNHQFPAHFTL